MLQQIFGNMNLTKKLSFSFVLLALIPVIIVTAISMRTMYTECVEQINEHNTYTARLKAGDMEGVLMNQISLMNMVAASQDVQSWNPEVMSRALQVAKKNAATVNNMFICDTTGMQVARDSGNLVNVSDRDYVKAILQQGKQFAFGEATISKTTKKVIIVASVPIKDKEGKLMGVMCSVFNMDTLTELLNAGIGQVKDRQEIIYMTDAKGNVMIHPESKYIETLTNWKSMAPIQAAASGNASAVEYVNAAGETSLAASAPAGVLNWAIVVENNRDEVLNVIYGTILKIALVSVILLVLIAIFARFLAGSFVSPLRDLEEKTAMMAEGDLTVSLKVNSDDEIGRVAAAFNSMTAHLNEVMSKITIASQQVASGSKNISDSGNMLAKGASTQASSVEELSASIAEITAQTASNAENATRANDLTLEANQKAELGNSRMEEMLGAMADINESSANIAKIIKVIDEIAFQTNILALNAAVEAARAGQHGKGFAVVAEEVRNLAARSAKAAKETTDIIGESINKVDAGTELARGTAEALRSIKEGVNEVASLVGEIADASQKQNTALQMLNQGVLQVSNVVQTNSATAEESASASVELSAQADLLQEAVSRFKV